jgi:carboxyl-terminal processing protease
MLKRRGWLDMGKLRHMRITAAIIAAILISTALPAAAGGTANAASAAELNDAERRLLEVLEVLAERHVSAPDEQDLTEAAIEGMIASLNDPYTEYLPPQALEDFRNAINQTYIGVGIRLGVTEAGYFVEEIFPGSSANDRNVRTGDRIVAVEGRSIDGWELEQVTGAIRGPEGSEVSLTLERGTERFTVSLVRKEVTIPAVEAKPIDAKTGYLRLTTFPADAGVQVFNALKKFEASGIDRIVLDLRDNPGGYLQGAQQVASLFLDSGVLIHTRDRDGKDEPIRVFNSDVPDRKLVVLVNGGSASASELLAGAFQDHEAATIVGERTFGKGSVQSVVNLDSGGALKVTIQEYFTPKGRRVNGVGIAPDIEVAGRIPQLITAINEARFGPLGVMLTASATRIGKAEFNETVHVLKEQGRFYVPSRVLAALVGEPIAWDGDRLAVVVGTGGAARTFRVGTPEAQLHAGTSYLELNAFGQAFPSFAWEEAEDGVLLTVGEGAD